MYIKKISNEQNQGLSYLIFFSIIISQFSFKMNFARLKLLIACLYFLINVQAENTSLFQKFPVKENSNTRWFQEKRIFSDESSSFEVVTLNSCKFKDNDHGLSSANQVNFVGCNMSLEYIEHLNNTLSNPIRRLQFFSSQLGPRMETVKYFKDLRYLNIVNSTNLYNNSWNILNYFQKLEYIKIESSRLGRFLEDLCVLCLPQSLKTLILKNSIIKLTSSDFAGLNILKFLDISRNNISVIQDNWRSPDGLLDDLVGLEVLDMSYNKFSNFNATFFKGVFNLKELSLARNEISYLPNDTFKALGKLIALDLSFNKLTEFHNELLYSTKHLKELNLIGNPISGLLKHDFREFKRLNVLFDWKDRYLWYRISDVFFDFYESEIRNL